MPLDKTEKLNNLNKQKILDQILLRLQQDLEALIETAKIAKDAATNEESKAENKYDTRGLEASYLAGAQSKRAVELQQNIYQLSKVNLDNTNSGLGVVSGTLVGLKNLDTENIKFFFLIPIAGGLKLNIDGIEIQSLSLDSPLGKNLLGKKLNESFEFISNNKTTDYEIVFIY